MNTERKERRLFKRVFFAKNDGITGTVLIFSSIGKKSAPITVNIMNLSAGGAEIFIKREDAGEIKTVERLTLQEINNCNSLEFCVNIEIEIKRILDNPLLDNIVIGCEFHGLSDAIKDRINQFVITEIALREETD